MTNRHSTAAGGLAPGWPLVQTATTTAAVDDGQAQPAYRDDLPWDIGLSDMPRLVWPAPIPDAALIEDLLSDGPVAA